MTDNALSEASDVQADCSVPMALGRGEQIKGVRGNREQREEKKKHRYAVE